MSLVLTDVPIIEAVREYRHISSGQLARVTGRSAQVIRRAIRKRLRPEGYLASIQRQPAEEAAYTLGPEGLAFVAHELGCPVSHLPFPKGSTSRGFFWRHTMLVNEIRIAFNLATRRNESLIRIERTIPEWELKPAVKGPNRHDDRFLLSERLKGPDGVTYWHRPDCLFLMRPHGDGAQQRVAAFVEADRNTESMKRIRDKLEAFWLYWYQQRFVDAFQAVAMRVLFVLDDVTNRQRIKSMQSELRELARRKDNGPAAEAFRRCFRFARKHDLDETTVLAQPIWYDADDQPRLFYRPVTQPSREPNAEANS